MPPPRAGLRFCDHKSSACQEKQTDFRGAQTKGSLREGAGAAGDWGRARYNKVNINFNLRRLLPSRSACHLPPGGRLFCCSHCNTNRQRKQVLCRKLCVTDRRGRRSLQFCKQPYENAPKEGGFLFSLFIIHHSFILSGFWINNEESLCFSPRRVKSFLNYIFQLERDDNDSSLCLYTIPQIYFSWLTSLLFLKTFTRVEVFVIFG